MVSTRCCQYIPSICTGLGCGLAKRGKNRKIAKYLRRQHTGECVAYKTIFRLLSSPVCWWQRQCGSIILLAIETKHKTQNAQIDEKEKNARGEREAEMSKQFSRCCDGSILFLASPRPRPEPPSTEQIFCGTLCAAARHSQQQSERGSRNEIVAHSTQCFDNIHESWKLEKNCAPKRRRNTAASLAWWTICEWNRTRAHTYLVRRDMNKKCVKGGNNDLRRHRTSSNSQRYNQLTTATTTTHELLNLQCLEIAAKQLYAIAFVCECVWMCVECEMKHGRLERYVAAALECAQRIRLFIPTFGGVCVCWRVSCVSSARVSSMCNKRLLLVERMDFEWRNVFAIRNDGPSQFTSIRFCYKNVDAHTIPLQWFARVENVRLIRSIRIWLWLNNRPPKPISTHFWGCSGRVKHKLFKSSKLINNFRWILNVQRIGGTQKERI